MAAEQRVIQFPLVLQSTVRNDARAAWVAGYATAAGAGAVQLVWADDRPSSACWVTDVINGYCGCLCSHCCRGFTLLTPDEEAAWRLSSG